MITIILAALAIEMVPVKVNDAQIHVSKYEVTQKVYEEVTGKNPSKFVGKDMPVENVSYDDAVLFIDKLNKKDLPYIFRLPTVEEWQLACNAGEKTRYHAGDDVMALNPVAWFRGNTCVPYQTKNGWEPIGGSTHIVGLLMPNKLGIYDLHGNVMEWCSDKDAKGFRAIKGGCWWSTDLDCSTNYTAYYPRDSRTEYVGIRLVGIKK